MAEPGSSIYRGRSAGDGRRRFARRLIRLLAVACCLAGESPAQSSRDASSDRLLAVVRVVDGDTLVVAGVGPVRLIGVDTPESVDPRRPVQGFGREAAAFTERLVAGRRVRLEYDWQRRDAYGRTLAYVFLPDGTFVNAEIVRQGYGFAYTRFPFKYLDEFRRLEREAREHGRGLWAPDACPPRPTPRATSPSRPSRPRSRAVTVYVTRSGSRYHRAQCRYVASGAIPLNLTEAARRYAPCSVCRPPVP